MTAAHGVLLEGASHAEASNSGHERLVLVDTVSLHLDMLVQQLLGATLDAETELIERHRGQIDILSLAELEHVEHFLARAQLSIHLFDA